MGMGWGAQIGAEVTDFIILLNSNSAVDAFAGRKQVRPNQFSIAAYGSVD